MSEPSEDLISLFLWNELCEDDVRPKRKRNIWTKEWYRKRVQFSHSNLMSELSVSAPDDFKNFLRMDKNTYDQLLDKVRPFIDRNDTQMRSAITPNERLSATLRFLASGQSFEDLKFLTAISPQSLGAIIIDTCSAINIVLREYIQIPRTQREWVTISDGFGKRWSFPNCVGAVDGKHVQIKRPANTGSYYFNYKKTFSIVLLAFVNANYEFLVVEAGANGRVSDGGVLQNSTFYENFKKNKFSIPESGLLHPEFKEEMPYVFVGDDAFPLKKT